MAKHKKQQEAVCKIAGILHMAQQIGDDDMRCASSHTAADLFEKAMYFLVEALLESHEGNEADILRMQAHYNLLYVSLSWLTFICIYDSWTRAFR